MYSAESSIVFQLRSDSKERSSVDADDAGNALLLTDGVGGGSDGERSRRSTPAPARSPNQLEDREAPKIVQGSFGNGDMATERGVGRREHPGLRNGVANARLHDTAAPAHVTFSPQSRLVDDKMGGCMGNFGSKMLFPFFRNLRRKLASRKPNKRHQKKEGNASVELPAEAAAVRVDASRLVPAVASSTPPLALTAATPASRGAGDDALGGSGSREDHSMQKPRASRKDVARERREPPASTRGAAVTGKDVPRAQETERRQVTSGSGVGGRTEQLDTAARVMSSLEASPPLTASPSAMSPSLNLPSVSPPRAEAEAVGLAVPRWRADKDFVSEATSLHFDLTEPERLEEAEEEEEDGSELASPPGVPVGVIPVTDHCLHSTYTATEVSADLIPKTTTVEFRKETPTSAYSDGTHGGGRTPETPLARGTRTPTAAVLRSISGTSLALHTTITARPVSGRVSTLVRRARRQRNVEVEEAVDAREEGDGGRTKNSRKRPLAVKAAWPGSYAALLPSTSRTAGRSSVRRSMQQQQRRRENTGAAAAQQVPGVRKSVSTSRGTTRRALIHASGRGGKNAKCEVQQVNNGGGGNSSSEKGSVPHSGGSYAQLAAARREYMQGARPVATTYTSAPTSTSSYDGNKQHSPSRKSTCSATREPVSEMCLSHEMLRERDTVYWRRLAALLRMSENCDEGQKGALAIERLMGALAARPSPYAGLTWREFKAQFYLSNSFSLDAFSPLCAEGTEPTTEAGGDVILQLSELLRPSCAACGSNARELWMLHLFSKSGKGWTLRQPSREWLYESVPPFTSKLSPAASSRQKQTPDSRLEEDARGCEEEAPLAPTALSASRCGTTPLAEVECSSPASDDGPLHGVAAVEPRSHAEHQPAGSTSDSGHDVCGTLTAAVLARLGAGQDSALPLYSPTTDDATAEVGDVGGAAQQHPASQEAEHATETTDATSEPSLCKHAHLDAEVISIKLAELDDTLARHFTRDYEAHLRSCEKEVESCSANGSAGTEACLVSLAELTAAAGGDGARDMGGGDRGAAAGEEDVTTLVAWMAERRRLQDRLMVTAAERNMLADQLRIYTTYDEAKTQRKMSRPVRGTQPPQAASSSAS
ncbi:hypothetical protein TRSC58_06521 [Trypanosoma rangeli SC58]|uniref:Uncharacterized protein n=1 Tax=Trypanosoma rangeli SC58 TaxID=429131 RepID=A0A061IV97_TRYRA|nr:hypothetical protein TRSC58_06521 [Trypanosoma rangeli SC58]